MKVNPKVRNHGEGLLPTSTFTFKTLLRHYADCLREYSFNLRFKLYYTVVCLQVAENQESLGP